MFAPFLAAYWSDAGHVDRSEALKTLLSQFQSNMQEFSRKRDQHDGDLNDMISIMSAVYCLPYVSKSIKRHIRELPFRVSEHDTRQLWTYPTISVIDERLMSLFPEEPPPLQLDPVYAMFQLFITVLNSLFKKLGVRAKVDTLKSNGNFQLFYTQYKTQITAHEKELMELSNGWVDRDIFYRSMFSFIQVIIAAIKCDNARLRFEGDANPKNTMDMEYLKKPLFRFTHAVLQVINVMVYVDPTELSCRLVSEYRKNLLRKAEACLELFQLECPEFSTLVQGQQLFHLHILIPMFGHDTSESVLTTTDLNSIMLLMYGRYGLLPELLAHMKLYPERVHLLLPCHKDDKTLEDLIEFRLVWSLWCYLDIYISRLTSCVAEDSRQRCLLYFTEDLDMHTKGFHATILTILNTPIVAEYSRYCATIDDYIRQQIIYPDTKPAKQPARKSRSVLSKTDKSSGAHELESPGDTTLPQVSYIYHQGELLPLPDVSLDAMHTFFVNTIALPFDKQWAIKYRTTAADHCQDVLYRFKHNLDRNLVQELKEPVIDKDVLGRFLQGSDIDIRRQFLTDVVRDIYLFASKNCGVDTVMSINLNHARYLYFLMQCAGQDIPRPSMNEIMHVGGDIWFLVTDENSQTSRTICNEDYAKYKRYETIHLIRVLEHEFPAKAFHRDVRLDIQLTVSEAMSNSNVRTAFAKAVDHRISYYVHKCTVVNDPVSFHALHQSLRTLALLILESLF